MVDKGRRAPDIGARLRRLRKQAGLSLEALARRCGVSKAMLSQVEQNKANPTVAVVWRIAQGLDLEISDIFGTREGRHRFEVIRGDDTKYDFLASDECTIRTLSPLHLEKDIEFYRIDLAPRGRLASAPHFHETEEFLFVEQGRVEVCSGGNRVVLRAGDSAHYSADIDHAIVNAGRGKATVLLVVKYRVEG